MSEVTRILDAIGQGDPGAPGRDELLPLVYDELRRLAAAQMAREKPGQTLDATALVHQAWLRLVGPEGEAKFDNRGHFFAAAARPRGCWEFRPARPTAIGSLPGRGCGGKLRAVEPTQNNERVCGAANTASSH